MKGESKVLKYAAKKLRDRLYPALIWLVHGDRGVSSVEKYNQIGYKGYIVRYSVIIGGHGGCIDRSEGLSHYIVLS